MSDVIFCAVKAEGLSWNYGTITSMKSCILRGTNMAIAGKSAIFDRRCIYKWLFFYCHVIFWGVFLHIFLIIKWTHPSWIAL